MQDETDRSAIEEDIRREEALQKEIEDLEELARRLEREHVRRLALMGEELLPSEASQEGDT